MTQPDGAKQEHIFGIRYGDNSGRLLGMRVKTAADEVLRSEINTYMTNVEATSAPFPSMYGSSAAVDDESTLYIRPIKRTAIVQQGVTFSRDVESFDYFARALRAKLSSSLPGSPARKEETYYSDNTKRWVMGQVAKVTCVSSTPEASGCNGGASSVASETSYDANWAVPLVMKRFGRTVQSLGYDTASSVASGQRGTIRTITDGNNKTTTVTGWKRGYPQSVAYPATPEAPSGTAWSARVNDSGWVTSVTDENGFVHSYSYDAIGRLKRIDYPAADTVEWSSTSHAYDYVMTAEYGVQAGHWRHTVTNGYGQRVSYLDGLLRPVVVREYDSRDPAGTQRFSRFTYDHEGRVTFASYPGAVDTLSSGAWTFYDGLGRVVQETADSELGPLNTATEYVAGFKTRVTPPKGTTARVTTNYLAWDRPSTDFPIAISHPAGAFTDISRDVFGKPISITRRNGTGATALTRRYVYNSGQLLCKSIDPESGVTVTDYDGVGNVLWSKSGVEDVDPSSCGLESIPAAQRITRTYDSRNRLRTLSFPDGRGNQAWTYTKDGLPATVSTDNGGVGAVVTNAYTYNKRRLLESEAFGIDAHLWVVTYQYDAQGHLAGHVTPGGVATDYAPNALGQATRSGIYATGVSYFPNGGMRQFVYGNGITHSLSQNARGLPDTSCDFSGGACSANSALNDGYDYDGHGNVVAISDGRAGSRGDRSMAYDALDRLTRVDSPMFGVAMYSYDVLDNIKSGRVTSGTKLRNHAYVYDGRNRLTNVTNATSGGTVIGMGYDPRGNLANRNGVIYDFDHGNRLREVSGAEQYRYDAHNRRVLSSRDGQKIYSIYGLDGALRFQRDERSGKTIDYVYLNGSLLAQVENAIALSTPVLTAPGSSATGAYVVSWTVAAVATSYQLRERVNSGGWSVIHNAGGVSKSLSGKSAGIWSYQVRACSATACGSWSVERSVTVLLPPNGSPVLTAPATGLNGAFIVSWTAQAAATRYELQEQKGGAAEWSTLSTASERTYSAAGRAAGNWNYRVRACNDAGCGAWSQGVTVLVLYPPVSTTLTAPAANSTGTYSVSWVSVSTAATYELHERLGSGAWSALPASGLGAAVTGRSSGSWGYRVRACNEAGCSAFSAEKTVVVTLPPTTPPTISTPATNSTGSFAVSWGSVASAARYELQERLNGGSWTLAHNAAGTSKAFADKAAGTYQYRVRACNAGGCTGYSPVGSTQVAFAPTGAPSLSLPALSQDGNYTASWTTVATATKYELQQRVNGGNWTGVGNPSDLSWPFAGRADGTYEHRVRGCNFAGCGPYSTQRTIVVKRPVPVPSVPTGISMEQVGPDWCRITWRPVSGASYYRIYLDGTIETAGGTRFNWDALCPGVLQVAACHAQGCSEWGY
ncbi:hypothetical protein ABE488_12930 [Luteimonas sp. TWI662]|uniref:RHS repeat domain-containing protein n=1 Tax=Luteimonas sp. TWI662 TaxID=3136789 RepID=UPI0032094482